MFSSNSLSLSLSYSTMAGAGLEEEAGVVPCNVSGISGVDHLVVCGSVDDLVDLDLLFAVDRQR